MYENLLSTVCNDSKEDNEYLTSKFSFYHYEYYNESKDLDLISFVLFNAKFQNGECKVTCVVVVNVGSKATYVVHCAIQFQDKNERKERKICFIISCYKNIHID